MRVRCRLRVTGFIRASHADPSMSADVFYARRGVVIRAFTCRVSGLEPHTGFAENRGPMRSNGKLLFNIRICTEDEINGTVKWVV